LNEVVKKYPIRVNPYYLSLIKQKDDAVWRQCVPDVRELTDPEGMEDPLHEEKDSPVPGLTHRYPDRVLLLVSNQCAMYCRFCTRKRKVGDPAKKITREQIMKGIDYIRSHPEIRDVILSGGDPLLLKDAMLEFILKHLRKISHLQIIRIGTRVPCALPQRITPELCSMLKKYHPLYVNVHFNHPSEITTESRHACEMLSDAGIPLGNQAVLLKGVNDNPTVMKELMQKLLLMRVKPYYIYQCDFTQGVNHFRTKVSKGLDIIKSLRGHTSGLAVPHYVIDAPGGGGKIPVQPEYVVEHSENNVVLKNYEGKTFRYSEPE
jgi:lysine 2,3-aminomutase